MVYWLCPRPAAPSGGVWFIHRLASLLNQAGVPSQVVQKESFDVWWDAHPINPTLINRSLLSDDLAADATYIVPEGDWHQVNLPTDNRKIMFMQNHIWLNREHFRLHLGEIVVCSRYLYNWCERELHVTPLGILTPFLDDDVWSPKPKARGRVLMLARRTESELVDKLFTRLQEEGLYPYVVSDAKTQRELSLELDQAEYYLHLVEPEGFPMICLEAFRSGTLVVGTTGGGGNEFMFDNETAMTVAGPKLSLDPNLDHFVEGIIAKLDILERDDQLRSKMWRQAYAWSQRYTAEWTQSQLRRVLHV